MLPPRFCPKVSSINRRIASSSSGALSKLDSLSLTARRTLKSVENRIAPRESSLIYSAVLRASVIAFLISPASGSSGDSVASMISLSLSPALAVVVRLPSSAAISVLPTSGSAARLAVLLASVMSALTAASNISNLSLSISSARTGSMRGVMW